MDREKAKQELEGNADGARKRRIRGGKSETKRNVRKEKIKEKI